ncbi:hypothetical protein AMAG_15376 [Allomyces macrogynus ATCC 38327]|uniref:Uncharacterized protein n=1 Tax=Allomyces macrogynus (strain ATCC 38327) TaxID=578462 RepID=A0A0L0T7B4_ALLM3|nr:hypothetical protein AMAG_15376 [Allomyces macrogynus ATCC 38327]|eukprot:KNE70620.1 hypothetical protein AMAG_15376 [Allomyces macrogynus ATCC 38327]
MRSTATRPARSLGHADAPPPPPTPPPTTPSDAFDDSPQLPRHAQQRLYLVNLVPPRGFGAGKYVPGHCFACAKCFATIPDTATAPEPCRALMDRKNCERAADLPPPEISKGVLVDLATVGKHIKNLLATSPYWNAVNRAARERDVPIVRFAITLCRGCLSYWNRAKRLDLNTAAAAATSTPTPAPAAPAAAAARAAAEPAAPPARSARAAPARQIASSADSSDLSEIDSNGEVDVDDGFDCVSAPPLPPLPPPPPRMGQVQLPAPSPAPTASSSSSSSVRLTPTPTPSGTRGDGTLARLSRPADAPVLARLPTKARQQQQQQQQQVAAARANRDGTSTPAAARARLSTGTPSTPAAAAPSTSTSHPTPPPSTARGSPAKRTRAAAYVHDDTDEDEDEMIPPKRAAVRARPTAQKPTVTSSCVSRMNVPSSSSPAPPPVPAPAPAHPPHVKHVPVLEFSAFDFGLAFDQHSLVPRETPAREGSEPHLASSSPVGPEPAVVGAAGAMPPVSAAVSALMQRLSGMGAMADVKVELPTPFNPDPAGPMLVPPPAAVPPAADPCPALAAAPAPPSSALPAPPAAPAAHATPTAATATATTPLPPANPTPASNELVLRVNFEAPAPLTAAGSAPSTGPSAPGAAAAGTVIPRWSDADLAAVPHDQRPPVDVMVRLLVAQMRAKTREQMIALGHTREEIERELQRVWEF